MAQQSRELDTPFFLASQSHPVVMPELVERHEIAAQKLPAGFGQRVAVAASGSSSNCRITARAALSCIGAGNWRRRPIAWSNNLAILKILSHSMTARD
jgi:hypothetical protein